VTEKSHPKTNGGRLLKRGDSFDPEDFRTTHRLRVGQSILASLGIESTFDHDEACPRHPASLSNVVHSYRSRVCCSCGRDYRGADWPAWVTGETFDLAYRLADEVQTERGNFNRSAAYAAKAERERTAS
jgi:hypothetical protein